MRIPRFSLPRQPKLEWQKRMLSWHAYKKHHSQEFPRMWNYWSRDAMGKSYLPSGLEFDQLTPKAAKYLYAVNMQSRMDFTLIVHRQLESYFDKNAVRGGHWITLAPPNLFVPLSASFGMELHALNGWVRHELRGLNYVGMLDLGLWYFHRRRNLLGGFVSFHVHVISWGSKPGDIEDRTERVSQAHRSPVPGRASAHQEPHLRRALLSRVFYMMKTPRNCSIVKPDVRHPNADPYVDRYPLHAKEIAQLYEVMGDRLLDKLIFGGGDGVELVKRMRTEALAPLPRWERNGLRKPVSIAEQRRK